MKPSIASLTDRFAPRSRWGAVELGPRQRGHGGMGWVTEDELRQPQDGALEAEASFEEIPSTRMRGSFARLNEPEDAGLTGATRSLGRRLLGLNVVSRPKPAVADLAGARRSALMKGRAQVA